MNNDLRYVDKMRQGIKVLDNLERMEDYPASEEYRNAVLKQLIEARGLFYGALDLTRSQEVKDSIRIMMDKVENILRDLQLGKLCYG